MIWLVMPVVKFSNKIIFLNKKKEQENINGLNNTINNNSTNNSSNSSDTLKNHITELILEFNQNLKNLKCHSSVVSQIKRIKEMKREDKKPCSELCYKNFLLCDENFINQYYLSSKDKQFPLTLELLLMKFVQMIKYDPCRLSKLIKPFIGKDKDNINYKIYFFLLSKKYNIKNIIRKELFDLNLKERELSKKSKSSFTQPQIKKIEENNLKRMNLTYTPCFHFGNEICDEKCSCYKRGYCEFIANVIKLYANLHIMDAIVQREIAPLIIVLAISMEENATPIVVKIVIYIVKIIIVVKIYNCNKIMNQN